MPDGQDTEQAVSNPLVQIRIVYWGLFPVFGCIHELTQKISL